MRTVVARGALVASAVMGCVLAMAPAPAGQRSSPALPSRLDQYLRSVVRLSADEHASLVAGQPVTRLLDADEKKEVAIFGAVWIAAPIRRYVEAVSDIEKFESGGGFKVTRRIGAPPRIEDFADLQLPAEDLADLRDCRVGKCEIKLGANAVHRFKTEIDWKTPAAPAAANALMRRLALEYVTRYLEGGNEQLAVYQDAARPTVTSQEFREMTGRMPELTTYMPDLRRYLLDYPRTTLPDGTSFLYWQETDFGLKPTIRISHLTIHEGRDDTVVASKMLYATHYFLTGIELRTLVPDPARGPGFWFVMVSRSRADGLGGFTGMFVRRRVRSEVRNGALAGLKVTKQKLERPSP